MTGSSVDNAKQAARPWLGTSIIVASIVLSVGFVWANMDTRIDQLERQHSDKEARLRQVEATITSMAQDIRWIRRSMEHR